MKQTPRSRLYSSRGARNPAVHAGQIVAVRVAEKRGKPDLVLARTPVEPDEVKRKHGSREPRLQREREAGEKNDVAEVHRVAAPAVGAARHEPLGRNLDSGTAPAHAQAVAAY